MLPVASQTVFFAATNYLGIESVGSTLERGLAVRTGRNAFERAVARTPSPVETRSVGLAVGLAVGVIGGTLAMPGPNCTLIGGERDAALAALAAWPAAASASSSWLRFELEPGRSERKKERRINQRPSTSRSCSSEKDSRRFVIFRESRAHG